MPPRLSSTTCSPSDGFHHVRALPARSVSQLIQLVSRSPVFTRQSQFSRSTSVTTPVRIRLVIRRMISVNCAFIINRLHDNAHEKYELKLCCGWHNFISLLGKFVEYRRDFFVTIYPNNIHTKRVSVSFFKCMHRL